MSLLRSRSCQQWWPRRSSSSQEPLWRI